MRRNAPHQLTFEEAYQSVLLVVTALALGLVTYNRVRPGGSVTLSDAFLGLAAILLIPWLVRYPRRIVALPRWLWLSAVVFALASIATAIFPAAPSRAALYFPGGPFSLLHGEAAEVHSNLGGLLRLELALLLVPFVICQVATDWRRIFQLANVWLAGIVFGGVVGLIAYAGNIHSHGLIGGSDIYEVTRVRAFTTHPNAFGDTAAMALPTAAAFWFITPGRRRWLYLLAALILVGVIGISGSRAAILGVVVGVCALGILERGSRKVLIRLGVAVLAVGLVVGVVALHSVPVLNRLGGGKDVNTSDNEREMIYSKVWSEVLHRPIVGHGFEYLRGSHDIYLQALHAGGMIALFALLTVLFGVTRIGYRFPGSGREAFLARALTASSLAWLLGTGIFEPAIYDRYLYVAPALLIACWAVENQDATSRNRRSETSA